MNYRIQFSLQTLLQAVVVVSVYFALRRVIALNNAIYLPPIAAILSGIHTCWAFASSRRTVRMVQAYILGVILSGAFALALGWELLSELNRTSNDDYWNRQKRYCKKLWMEVFQAAASWRV